MNKKRLYLFDNLKFLLIFCVVAGHFIDNGGDAFGSDAFLCAFIFIYSFHMPLFIFISGLFFSERNTLRKMLFYILTGALLNILIFVSKNLTYHYGTLSFVHINGTPWFMLALAAFTGLTRLLIKFDKRIILAVSLILAIAAGFAPFIGDFLSVSRIIVFYPFYVLGTMLEPKRLEAATGKRKLKAAGAAVIAIWLAVCILFFDKIYTLRKLFTGVHPYAHLPSGMVQFGWAYRILCYAVSALLCFAFICVMPRRRVIGVSKFGERTLQVYFWHLPFVYVIHILDLTELLSSLPWGLVLSAVICIAITVLLSQKPFEYPVCLIKKLVFDKGKSG